LAGTILAATHPVSV